MDKNSSCFFSGVEAFSHSPEPTTIFPRHPPVSRASDSFLALVKCYPFNEESKLGGDICMKQNNFSPSTVLYVQCPISFSGWVKKSLNESQATSKNFVYLKIPILYQMKNFYSPITGKSYFPWNLKGMGGCGLLFSSSSPSLTLEEWSTIGTSPFSSFLISSVLGR